jgi:hypothetical protein
VAGESAATSPDGTIITGVFQDDWRSLTASGKTVGENRHDHREKNKIVKRKARPGKTKGKANHFKSSPNQAEERERRTTAN